MTSFTITRRSHVGVERLWTVVTDLGRHGESVPATTMHTDEGPMGLGWGFAAVTGAGPVRFSDEMVVTGWSPPVDGGEGWFRIVKIGWLLSGWAEVRVTPDGSGGSVLTWTEELGPRPAPLGRLAAPVSRRLGQALFGRAVDDLVAAAEQDEGAVGG